MAASHSAPLVSSKSERPPLVISMLSSWQPILTMVRVDQVEGGTWELRVDHWVREGVALL